MSADSAARDRLPLAITGASGAIYATRTLAALLERGCHLELVVSDTAGACCATNSATRRGGRLTDYLVGDYGEACAAAPYTCYSNKDLGAAIASGSQDCEAMVDRPVLDEDAGRRSRTACRATWSSARPT